ncbi:RNAse P Rpr2/Rpp21/SNM1 subunit domain [Nakaseomyces bracarensis]|uniref:RNAse P Rpr2/Rpp21/SNM1 subunit domain n=1 Tax=Nakaseomyces bracarensis TaxID=273131 RepID=A0ABR4NVF5_9SACH
MAKKVKGKNGKNVGNKEHLQRINYLAQLSGQMAKPGTELGLTQLYNRNLVLVSHKTKTKLSPNLKRRMCKRCRIEQIPGITSAVRIEPQNRAIAISCNCQSKKSIKRFPLNEGKLVEEEMK